MTLLALRAGLTNGSVLLCKTCDIYPIFQKCIWKKREFLGLLVLVLWSHVCVLNFEVCAES